MATIPKLYAQYCHFELLIDSRQLTDPQRTLFFALTGERTDGHQYISELVSAGVRHFVVTENWWTQTFEQNQQVKGLSNYADVVFIAVSDVLETLQLLAAHHRKQFDIPVVGITGSNGKTIVKDWLSDLLQTTYQVCSSPRSYNSQIGVPLSVWQLNETHEVAVFEAGISKTGEMENLANVIQPTHGIFTYLGDAHATGFDSQQQKLMEKLKLFGNAKWVLCKPDQTDSMLLSALDELTAEVFIVKEQDLIGTNHLAAIFRYNAGLASAAARLLGVSAESIVERVKKFQPIEHRLKVRSAANGCFVIDDSYSNDLSSLQAALQFATAQSSGNKFTLFLSDIPQSSESQAELYKKVAHALKPKIKRLFAIGAQVGILKDLLPEIPVFIYRDTASLVEDIDNHLFQQETILVKGARVFQLEQLMDALTQRRHRTLLEVNLSAISHNFSVYQKHLPNEVGIAVMVKASAYGSGSVQVARLLAEAGAKYLVVAYTDEGIQLREAGITAPIMVLNPERNEFGLLQSFQLEPVIAEESSLQFALSAYPDLPLHLEFDTGMRRLGFSPASAHKIACYFVSPQKPAPASIFTHLAASESARFDEYTQQQFDLFEAVCNAFLTQGVAVQIRHVLNTNGISRFPDQAYEMVRLGIGLYGLGDQELASALQPAISLKAAISSVRKLKKGDRLGYGLKGEMIENGLVGVVSIGYADGLPRMAGEGRYALLIQGKPAPIVGVVCMDMCMVDLSEHPTVDIDEEVIVFGPEHPIEQLAEVAQTIPYEILTGIGGRVHRVYVSE